MLKKRFWLSVLIAGASLVSIIVFWLTLQQSLRPQKPDILVNNKQMVSDEADRAIMKIPGATKDAYWELHVAKIESINERNHLQQVEGTYFSNKQPFYWITGKTGVLDLKTRILHLNGNVVLKTNDAKQLDTEELIWDPTVNKITARQGAVLKTPETTVNTEDMVADIKLEQMSFNGLTKVLYERVDHD